MRTWLSTVINKMKTTHMKIQSKADIHHALTIKLPDLNNRFHYVNSGGCGVIAFNLAKRLRNLGIPADVVMVGDIDGPGALSYTKSWLNLRLHRHYVTNISELTLKLDSMITDDDESAKRDLPNGHLCVKVLDKLYDATGDVSDRYIDITGPITNEAMNVMLKQQAFWNPTFMEYHKTDMPDIYLMLDQIMNDLKVTA